MVGYPTDLAPVCSRQSGTTWSKSTKELMPSWPLVVWLSH